jgi:hypothetical protein
MRTIQNSTGPISNSETPGEAGDFTASFTGKDYYHDLINRANTVPLVKLFKHYGLHLDDNNRRIICPFSSHQGGRESSGSFYFYPQTNTFWCFGCKTGVAPCDLVAGLDGCSKVKAAMKILESFGADTDDDNIFDRELFTKKLEIMMEFSTAVRDFSQSNTDQKARSFIEYICSVYDDLNMKHKDFSNEALRRVVDELKEEISSYNV